MDISLLGERLLESKVASQIMGSIPKETRYLFMSNTSFFIILYKSSIRNLEAKTIACNYRKEESPSIYFANFLTPTTYLLYLHGVRASI